MPQEEVRFFFLFVHCLTCSLPKYFQQEKERAEFRAHFVDAENAPPIGNGATLSPSELAHRAFIVKTFFEAGIPLSKIKEYELQLFLVLIPKA